MDVGRIVLGIASIALWALILWPLFKWLGKKGSEQIEKAGTLCPHGVRGGQTRSRCEICESERQRIEAIRKKATELDRAETQRIAQANLKRLEGLMAITPKEFEDSVARMFERLGYKVQQTPYVGDRGKDAILLKGDTKLLLECKRFGRDKMVGRPHMQKFFAAIHEENAKGGFFVTTGQFSGPARDYAPNYNIKMIGPDDLVSMMKEAFPDSGPEGVRRVMCLQCGEVLEVQVSTDRSKHLCSQGHETWA